MRILEGLVNKNYLIGYRFEMRVVAFFRKLGYFVIRSPKSKGLTDVTAIPPFVKTGWFNQTIGIQAKRTDMSHQRKGKNFTVKTNGK